MTIATNATPATPLQPGGTGDLVITATNPNPYAVQVTALTIGTVTGCTTPAVSLVTPSGNYLLHDPSQHEQPAARHHRITEDGRGRVQRLPRGQPHCSTDCDGAKVSRACHVRRSLWLVWIRRHVAVLLLGGIGLVGLAGVTAAYWTVAVNSGPHGSATAASLSTPTSPTNTVNGSGAITIGWSLPTSQLSGTQYLVTRTSGPGSPTTVCTVASNVTSCQDAGLSAGTSYGYSVMAVLGSNWQSSAITTSATTAKASPTLSVTTSPSTGTAGTAISASSLAATLGASSGTNDTSTITFSVFGPSSSAPTTCTSGGTTVGTATPAGNGAYTASGAGFTPSVAGNYWWYASSPSNANNNAAASLCNSVSMPETTVAVASPTLSVTTSPSTGNAGTAIAGSLSATMVGSSGTNATAPITFTVFGPGSEPTSCTSGGHHARHGHPGR